jgi:hypothetical protein
MMRHMNTAYLLQVTITPSGDAMRVVVVEASS